jgi:hypothetical protein
MRIEAMLKKLTQTFRDMGTIKALCEVAERIANAEHQAAPGAEHFVLAALELPDGSAARVFAKLGLTASAFAEAVRQTHRAALEAVGVGADQIRGSERDVPPLPEPREIYNAAPSGQAVLIGAHVLEVVSAMQHGTTQRAFALLGRDAPTVMAAVQSEMKMAA